MFKENRFSEIIYQVDGSAAIITLNRPAQLNAWTDSMGDEVRQAFELAETDSQVVGIIFTGADRAFCAGADLSILDKILTTGDLGVPAASMPGDASYSADYRQTYSYIASIRKPVIAAIHGACVGMALPLALFCDLRFASTEAYFITAYSQRGLIAEWGCSWMLPRLVGNAHALDMLLSSRRIGANEALGMGMLNRVVPAAELLAQAKSYIADLALNCSPTSMSIIKRQIYQDWMQSLEHSQIHAEELLLQSFHGADFKESIAAMTEKRPAKFKTLSPDRSQ